MAVVGVVGRGILLEAGGEGFTQGDELLSGRRGKIKQRLNSFARSIRKTWHELKVRLQFGKGTFSH